MKYGLAAIILAGCSFPTPSEQYACTVSAECEGSRICDQGYCIIAADNVIDSPPLDVPPSDTGPRFACAGWTPRLFDPCAIPQPTAPLALTAVGTYTYDTTDGSLTDPGGGITTPPNMLVTAGRVISIDALDVGATSTLRVVGNRPLIVAAWTTIDVAGTISATSIAAGPGAGANPTSCVATAPTVGGSSGDGAGGAGGGGYGGNGGPGGDGDAAQGGNGGPAVAITPPLLGGCAGATGGTGDAAGGAGGAGGGAFQLTAQMALTIASTGKLTAGGAGGDGAAANGGNDAQGGGGGGGSGGMIGLQGATITVSAGGVVAANGGGGGGGASQGAGGRGADGGLTTTRATGGTASNNAGPGGLGGAGLTKNGTTGQNSAPWGGGGGGGGVGFVVFTSPAAATTTGAIVSPAATLVAP